jgi:hypothetical protein
MNIDDGTIRSSRLPSQLRLMRGAGVRIVHFPVYWSMAQPVENGAVDLTSTDRIVGAAARSGLRVLPCVVGAPVWDRQYPDQLFSPPMQPEPYAAFVSALVARYGPTGSFWAAHRDLARYAIRDWQVWNEENGGYTWSDDERRLQPESRTHWVGPYLRLLKATRAAVRRADPQGRIVLGGLVGQSWKSLGALYGSEPSARNAFDVVALHPYTKLPANVVKAVRLGRKVMRDHGDERKPVMLTEFGWTSSVGHVPSLLGMETTQAGQARRLALGLTQLAASRRALRIESVYWYDWAEPERGSYVFSYAGLWRRTRDGRLIAKPAFAAFRRTTRWLAGG